mgnify:CR=1 FL=1
MKEELINKAYEIAKERYAALGLDVEKVVSRQQETIPVKPVIWKNCVPIF